MAASGKQERAQILKMVSEGKISAEEGARLLNAIASHDRPERPTITNEALRGRWLRFRVLDLVTDKPKVNFSLPMGLVSVGLRLGAQFVPELADIDLDEFMTAIDEGTQGKILEVEDPEGDERVEIFIE
ncbi:MAG: DUF2089 domain-containing protein [Chloroflexi bacterium]|nr:DUF2089 domain-containing protein [Chloroflexota bacterium]